MQAFTAIAAPVAVAVPPRLDLTETVVGGTRVATPVPPPVGSMMKPGASRFQQGSTVGQTATAGVLLTSTMLEVMGFSELPGMPAGRVSLEIVASMNMPAGAGLALETTTR